MMSHVQVRGMSERVGFLPDICALHHFTLCKIIFQDQMGMYSGGGGGHVTKGLVEGEERAKKRTYFFKVKALSSRHLLGII